MIPFPFQSGGLGLVGAAPSSGPPPAYRSRLQFGGADGSTTFTDDTGKTWTAFGNAQIDTSLGDQRGLFDGASDYIKTPHDSGLNFGTGDFLISFIQRYSSIAGFQTLCTKGYPNATSGSWLVQTGSGDGRINFYALSPSATLVAGETTGTINTGQDYLIEIQRIGTAVTIKRDGLTVASGTSSFDFNGTGELSIGGGSSTGYNNFWFNGWVKDFFIQ